MLDTAIWIILGRLKIRLQINTRYEYNRYLRIYGPDKKRTPVVQFRRILVYHNVVCTKRERNPRRLVASSSGDTRSVHDFAVLTIRHVSGYVLIFVLQTPLPQT